MIKIKPMLLCILLAVLGSGCSFRFVYNHLDWWTNWYLDDYVTLNEQQQHAFDDEFEQLHLWHRKTQLPAYAQQLKKLQLAINGQIERQQVIDNLAQFTEHWQNFLIAAEPKLQPLAYSLSTKQKQQLMQAIKEGNQDKLDDNEDFSDQEWLEERSDDQKDQLKEWFGKLTAEQKAQVTLISKNFQRSFEHRMAYRQRWSHQFSELLNGDLPDHQFKFEFYRLFVTGRSLRDEKFNAIAANNNQIFADIFVYMVSSANEKQRKRINKKLDKVIWDLEYLINED
ncbi:hypothetical protein H4J38_10720 [Colwellia sp. BRX10-3]|uniref:DUF6279 family lipoprotein n=1 Tax=Colwellia sp. BRX10-3 TaxID=2759844 RepID=UPI0015F4DFC0|nr:DUF6279 family lipoprotein [Colwellia sp. BRX10-3]MBA6391243.1 hypothetical protein [Colwellia sp. BRX10-3]